MRRTRITSVAVSIAASAVFSIAARPGVAQAPAARGQAAPSASRIPRMPDGKPNLSGLWQSIGTANWDIQDHSAQPGPFFQLGAVGAIPAGQGIVDGNEIPYRPEALAKKNANNAKRWELDPELKCFMPGVPRATYMPFPFQIVQGNRQIAMAYEFATSNRVINLVNHQKSQVDTWMGTSNGTWNGDTLVVDVTGFNDLTWFDRAGNHHSDALHVVERYTFRNPDVVDYEATIDDPKVFTRPWKIGVPLYRRLERNARLLEFKCVEFAEELIYGHLKRK